MSNTKQSNAVAYTPGPWMVGSCYELTAYVQLDKPYLTRLAEFSGMRRTDEENLANLTLAAAAPEMAEALLKVHTDMLRDDFDSENDRCDYVLNYVRAALAKAGL